MRAENINGRIGIFLLGIFCAGYGILQWRAHGPFVYFNERGLPLYPGGVIALGIFLVVVALLPNGKWLERLTALRKKNRKGGR